MGIFSFDESELYLEMDAKIEKYKKVLKEVVEQCPAGLKYNVFGNDTDKVCCYRYHNYCENVENCYLKKMIEEI